MTYFVVESFGHGLDVRKHIMALPPGSLYRAQNCVINRGGEPESAKAWVPKDYLPVGTFGFMQAGGNLFVFGSGTDPGVPSGIVYQQLAHPSAGSMTAVLWATAIKGKPFVIATYTGGAGVFFNGAIITDWLPPGASALMRGSGPRHIPPGDWDKSASAAPFTAPTDFYTLAQNLAAQINTDPDYTAVVNPSTLTIRVTGRPNTAWAYDASNPAAGGTATKTLIQNSAGPGPETLATGTVTYSGVTAEWNADLGYYVPVTTATTCTVNGVEILGRFLVSYDDAGAASALCNYINIYHSTPQYTATVSGTVVTIHAAPGTGAAPDGFVVYCDGPWATMTDMVGGVNATSGAPQIVDFTLNAPAFDATKTYSITLGGAVFTQASVILPPGGTGGDPSSGGGDPGGAGGGAVGAQGQVPTCALVKNSKTYAIAGPNLFGSAVGDTTTWNSGTGSFVTDMSSEVAGAATLTALGLFQGNMAIFSRSTVQIEFVDPDPSNNEQIQVLQNIGTMAPKSVTQFGDTDVFFLADTGVRSLKVRLATDNATVNDIGSPIDPIIIDLLRLYPTAAPYAAGVIEPVDGRFLLQFGANTYAFSYFPDAKVAAWTVLQEGMWISDFAVRDNKLYARGSTSGGAGFGTADVICLLGGDNNDQYSVQAMDLKIPFLSSRQIATLKHFLALDVVCDGTLDVSIATDPLYPDNEELIATVSGTTLGLGGAPFSGENVSAISIHFQGRPSQYCRLSGIALHHAVMGETYAHD
jgi:hypothetical protein